MATRPEPSLDRPSRLPLRNQIYGLVSNVLGLHLCPSHLRRVHVPLGEHARVEMKVRGIHAHQSRQQHTLDRLVGGRQMIAVHEDALLRCVPVQIDVHEQIAIVQQRVRGRRRLRVVRRAEPVQKSHALAAVIVLSIRSRCRTLTARRTGRIAPFRNAKLRPNQRLIRRGAGRAAAVRRRVRRIAQQRVTCHAGIACRYSRLGSVLVRLMDAVPMLQLVAAARLRPDRLLWMDAGSARNHNRFDHRHQFVVEHPDGGLAGCRFGGSCKHRDTLVGWIVVVGDARVQ